MGWKANQSAGQFVWWRPFPLLPVKTRHATCSRDEPKYRTTNEPVSQIIHEIVADLQWMRSHKGNLFIISILGWLVQLSPSNRLLELKCKRFVPFLVFIFCFLRRNYAKFGRNYYLFLWNYTCGTLPLGFGAF